jgi:hypothetical protein
MNTIFSEECRKRRVFIRYSRMQYMYDAFASPCLSSVIVRQSRLRPRVFGATQNCYSATMSNSRRNLGLPSDSKRVERIHVYQLKLAAGRLRFYHVVFILLYLYQISWVCQTIGEPYRAFLEKADREGFQGKNKANRYHKNTKYR